MATSDPDIKTRVAKLRDEILSYTPGQAKPCDDERVEFPEKLVIGVIDPWAYAVSIVPALRHVLHGDIIEESRHADDDQEKYLTDNISVMYYRCRRYQEDNVIEEAVSSLEAKSASLALCLREATSYYWPMWIQQVKKITGRPPICFVYGTGGISHEGRKVLKEQGITSSYPILSHRSSVKIQPLSDKGSFQLLSFLHGCLVEGDVKLGHDLKNFYKNVAFQNIYETERKKVTEARQETRMRSEENKVLQKEYQDLKTKLHDLSSSHDCLINENVSLKNELKDVQERKTQTQEAMDAIKITATRMEETYKKSELKHENELRAAKMRIDALMEAVKKTEETAKQEIEGLKTEREEERARIEEETQSIELEKEKEIAFKKLRIEQLERETWKLRAKIQLETEMRSAEQKIKTENPQWLDRLIPRIASGKQAQTATSETRESSEGRSSYSDTSDDLPSREDPPNDAFAGTLKQIADDLYDDSKIDSLGGQLGIIQGDIKRALQTNLRFNNVTSDGTRHMLQQWRRGVSREDERGELRRALLAAKLVDLADRYVPEETGARTEVVHPKKVTYDQPLCGKDGTPVAREFTKRRREDLEDTSFLDHTPAFKRRPVLRD